VNEHFSDQPNHSLQPMRPRHFVFSGARLNSIRETAQKT